MKIHLTLIRSICTWTFLAALVGFASVAQGQVVNATLVITENSSTSLTAAFNGSAVGVTLVSPDSWTLNLTGVTNRGFAYWAEPENPTTEANQVIGLATIVRVSSDITPVSGEPVSANGATDVTDLSYNGDTLQVTFIDNGDTPSSVPDAAGTFSLLGLSLAALAILKRSQPFQRFPKHLQENH